MKGKYCNIEQLNPYDQDFRLTLIGKLSDLLKKKTIELRRALEYRYAIEQKVRMHQETGVLFNQVTIIKEEKAYEIVVCLMYYLALLKHPFFNFSQKLRLKIFCKQHAIENLKTGIKPP